MVRDRRLTDLAARAKVARAHVPLLAQLADDRQAGRVRERPEEQDVRVGGLLHASIISTNFDIDKCRYDGYIARQKETTMFTQYPPELARLINQERIDEARRSMRGFCCAEDRRDLEKARWNSNRTQNQPAACSC